MSDAKSVSTTELVRNCASIIDEVQASRESVLITKGKRVVAELLPAPKSSITAAELFRRLRDLPGLGDDAEAMKADIGRARDALKLPDSRWD